MAEDDIQYRTDYLSIFLSVYLSNKVTIYQMHLSLYLSVCLLKGVNSTVRCPINEMFPL